jgi:hypothetical protein
LFFIPVFPYESKYRLTCPICSWGVELSGSQIATAKQLNATTTAYLNKQMTDDLLYPRWHSDEGHAPSGERNHLTGIEERMDTGGVDVPKPAEGKVSAV